MDMRITWLGQGGYKLEFENKCLLIDPYLSDSVEKLTGKKRMIPVPIDIDTLKIDYCITTHDHLDHLDPDTVDRMDKEQTIFIGPDSCCEHFHILGCQQVIPLNRDKEMRIGNMMLEAVYAEHTKDSIGLVITYGDRSIYLVGDSLYSDRLMSDKTKASDILIVCINGKLGNMSADEAALLTEKLMPNTGIPSHYGMFAENTADPNSYFDLLNKVNGFEMQVGKTYIVEEMISCSDYLI